MESSCPNEKQLVAQVASSFTGNKTLRVAAEECYDSLPVGGRPVGEEISEKKFGEEIDVPK